MGAGVRGRRKYARGGRDSLRLHVKPALGDMPVGNVAATMAKDFYAEVRAGADPAATAGRGWTTGPRSCTTAGSFGTADRPRSNIPSMTVPRRATRGPSIRCTSVDGCPRRPSATRTSRSVPRCPQPCSGTGSREIRQPPRRIPVSGCPNRTTSRRKGRSHR